MWGSREACQTHRPYTVTPCFVHELVGGGRWWMEARRIGWMGDESSTMASQPVPDEGLRPAGAVVGGWTSQCMEERLLGR